MNIQLFAVHHDVVYAHTMYSPSATLLDNPLQRLSSEVVLGPAAPTRR